MENYKYNIKPEVISGFFMKLILQVLLQGEK